MATGMGVDETILKAAASLEYSDLKPEQKCILKAFVEGKDVFVALPTGFGKSLCYALLPLIFDMKRRAWSLGLYLDCCHMYVDEGTAANWWIPSETLVATVSFKLLISS